MMPDIIANSVFKVGEKEYRPGEIVPGDLPDMDNLMEKGLVVWNGGEKAAREAAEKEAAEKAAREAAEKAAREAAEKEAAEKAAREAAEREAAEKTAREDAEREAEEKATSETEEKKEKTVKGRKAKVEE
ncbi:hypothetical protein [Anaerotignum sp.]